MKRILKIALILFALFALTGCKEETVFVSFYSEEQQLHNQKEFSRLKEKFKDMTEYQKSQDPEFNYYNALAALGHPYAYLEKKPNLSATVDLKNKHVLLNNEIVSTYTNNSNGEIEIITNQSKFNESILIRFIETADEMATEKQGAFISKMLKTLWLPIVLYAYGIFAFLNPEKAFHFGGAWKYKNLEPSDSGIFLYQAGGIWSMILATIILILIFAS